MGVFPRTEPAGRNPPKFPKSEIPSLLSSRIHSEYFLLFQPTLSGLTPTRPAPVPSSKRKDMMHHSPCTFVGLTRLGCIRRRTRKHQTNPIPHAVAPRVPITCRSAKSRSTRAAFAHKTKSPNEPISRANCKQSKQISISQRTRFRSIQPGLPPHPTLSFLERQVPTLKGAKRTQTDVRTLASRTNSPSGGS